MTKVLWRQYREWSGCLIRGTAPVVPQDPARHLSCAAWLTAEAEGPSYGFVQSYDGAGISAGLLHNVLVLPREMVQGDLGALVRRMLAVLAVDDYARPPFEAEVDRMNWTLAPDGKFRTADGKLVSASDLRNWASPPNGHVPQRGAEWEQAARVATLFHDLFAHYRTYKVQEDFAIEWLARGKRAEELHVYQAFTEDGNIDSVVTTPVSALPSAIHVAMCVYHSFSVNSPAIAAKCLASVHITPKDPVGYAKKLIRELGVNGRDAWHDQPGDGNNRYDRTRVALWGEPELFPDGRNLMPRDLT